MAFNDLPPQSPINIRADAYVETAFRLSLLAAMTTRVELDIPYGENPWQKVDVYLPREKNLKGLPVFINIHGGGWTHGHKEWMGLNAPPIIAFPAVYVSVGYRLAPEFKHPAQLQDCLNALVWVYQNASRFGGSPDRIFIGGHSAGGHLSALVTLRRDLWSQYGLPGHVIRACFPYCGVYDFCDTSLYGCSPDALPIAKLVPDAAAAADTSPIRFVAGNEIPFFITWSENDNVLVKAQNPTFVRVLKDQPGRVECHMFPLLDHFWPHIDQQRPENLWTRTLKAWMLGDPRTTPVPDA